MSRATDSGYVTATATATAVAEPASLSLLAPGMLGVALGVALGRRRSVM